jgi:hypothetical protein
METSLHRELKSVYGGAASRQEVPLAGYRIDVVDGDRLIEIQHGSLSAIRRKISDLVATYSVVVVKPIVERKTLVKLDQPGGEVIERRLSPKRGSLWDIFHELVYFTRVFPHPNLTLEVPLVEVEEWRYPGHGRRRRWRRNDYQVADEKLIAIRGRHAFRSQRDLLNLLPRGMPRRFDTGDLAAAASIPRWIAQRVTYCLRHAGALREVGKRGNAILYHRQTCRD